MTPTMTPHMTSRPRWAGLALRVAMTLVFVVGVSSVAQAGEYSHDYSGDFSVHGGNYGNGSGSSGGYSNTSSRSGSGRSYSAYYRSGGSGFGWLNYRRGQDNSTGYSGAGSATNTPHRADWYAKLKAQRKWDEEQFKQAQARRGVECGLSGAPAYCYKLMGPYPTEMKLVRY